MKVKRFYILFMCILLMCTTIIISFADSYGCVTSIYNETTQSYVIDNFHVDGNDYILQESVIAGEFTTYYAVSVNGIPPRIEYNGKYLYTFLGSLNSIVFVLTDTYYVSGDIIPAGLAIPGRICSLRYSLDNGSYSDIQYSYSSRDIVDDVINNIYGFSNISYENDTIRTSYTVCNVNNFLKERSPEFMAVITAILSVFTAIGDWFVEIIPTVLTVFWTPGVDGGEGSLTIIGALAVASLAIAVILLILRWIVEFFRFRG